MACHAAEIAYNLFMRVKMAVGRRAPLRENAAGARKYADPALIQPAVSSEARSERPKESALAARGAYGGNARR